MAENRLMSELFGLENSRLMDIAKEISEALKGSPTFGDFLEKAFAIANKYSDNERKYVLFMTGKMMGIIDSAVLMNGFCERMKQSMVNGTPLVV